MITYVDDGLFTAPAQTLVNAVNTVGVMGRGVAREFRLLFPEMFIAYKRHCKQHLLTPGTLHLFRTPNKWILNIPTKRHWQPPSRLSDIEAGLRTFACAYQRSGITSAAFPQLGCGTGGLDWDRQVRPLMESILGGLPIPVSVHLYASDPVLPILPNGFATELTETPNDLRIDTFVHDFLLLKNSPPSGSVPNTSDLEISNLYTALQRTGYASLYSVSSADLGHIGALLDLGSRLPYMARATVYRQGDRAGPVAALSLRPGYRLQQQQSSSMQDNIEELLWIQPIQKPLPIS